MNFSFSTLAYAGRKIVYSAKKFHKHSSTHGFACREYQTHSELPVFINDNKNVYASLSNLQWPHSLPQRVNITKIADDNTNSQILYQAIKVKEFCLYTGTLYSLKQKKKKIDTLLKISKREDKIAQQAFPECFHAFCQLKNSVFFAYNQILLELPSPPKSSLILKSIEHVSLIKSLYMETLNNSRLTENSKSPHGYVIGLGHFMQLKRRSKFVDCGMNVKLSFSSGPDKVFFPSWTSDQFARENFEYLHLLHKVVTKSQVFDSMPENPKILNTCCGNGTILYYLIRTCKELKRTDAQFFGTDMSQTNAKSTIRNLEFHNLHSNATQVSQADLWPDTSSALYDLIVAYPPFLPSEKRDSSDQTDTHDYKGKTIRNILSQSFGKLKENGVLILLYPSFAEFFKLDGNLNFLQMAQSCGLKFVNLTEKPYSPDKYNQCDILGRFKNQNLLRAFTFSKQ